MEMNLLKRLPHEVLSYIFNYYLDLHDLWKLTQVSKGISELALGIIKKQWGIELCVLDMTTNHSYTNIKNSLFKTQLDISMVILNSISHKLLQRIKIYNPYAFPPFIEPPQNATADVDDYDISMRLRFNSWETISPARFIARRLKYHSSGISSIIDLESKLHQDILYGLGKYVEGGNLGYSFKTVIDIIFHHTIFVSSKDRLTGPKKLGGYLSRTFAAAVSRLLGEIKSSFPNNAEVISSSLYSNTNMCLAFTEYRLLSVMEQFDDGIHFEDLKQIQQQRRSDGQPLLYLLYTITGLVDLIGACYMASHIKDDHAISAIKRLSKILNKARLPMIRKSVLRDLVDVWLDIGTYGSHSAFRSVIIEEELNHPQVG